MRAVSFFGAAAFTGSAPAGAGAGLRGTVGRPAGAGGLGGGMPGAAGLDGGTPNAPGGLGGPGGFGGPEGVPPSEASVGNLLVSFFGAVPGGATGLPGTLMRTVSRFTAGCSVFGGSVIRMVSFFVASSPDSGLAGGFSSAIGKDFGD